MPYLLVSATYNGRSRKAVLKFYDPESGTIRLLEDQTGHLPYCYSRLPPSELGHVAGRDDVEEIKEVELLDLLAGKKVKMTKISAADPLAIGGTASERSLRNTMETWESDIKYYETYLYDRDLVVGRHYDLDGNRIREVAQDVPASVRERLSSLGGEGMADRAEFEKYLKEWAGLLSEPIPELRRVAVDIEVDAEEGRIPDPKKAERRVTAVGLAGTGGYRRVLVLRSGAETGRIDLDFEPEFYDDEKKMLQDAFEAMTKFAFVLTYNGDDFDLPYMYKRADNLGVPDAQNPLYMMRDAATLKHGVHLDLYRTMSNRSFQIYAFSHAYSDFSLESVSQALLGRGKKDHGAPLSDLTLHQTASYCYNDALLTYDLTAFDGGILMNLLVVIARIGRMPIDDIARLGVSQWIRSLLYHEHRRRGALIPRREDLEGHSARVSEEAVIKNKKYRGGLVVDPKEGVHFDVTVMDFASLYPSIIKVRNLSYETVRCPHERCHSNTIPQTDHWVCAERNGLTAVLIGSLRDLRVGYYKSLARDSSISEERRRQYTAVSQALKVILNASYGVMGAEIFPLYFLPVAEATTAIGRHTILETIRACEDTGLEVLYGDTDSIFLKEPTREQINSLSETAKRDHGVDLEVDKEYRYVVLSDRKKNYFGVTKSGNVDVKGLTGKKSHTPKFIKNLFYDLVGVLSEVQDAGGFEKARTDVSSRIAECARRVQDRDIPVEDLAYKYTLSKDPSEYTKTIPQHIRAAKMLEPGRTLRRGDTVSYIKTLGGGVKPVELAKPGEIDPSKYIEFIESTLEQIVSSMDLDFDTILGKPKQVGLDEFFWK